MPIVGERPETGVRIAIERPREGGPPWTYSGVATLPQGAYAASVTVSAEGDVEVVLSPSTPGEGDASPLPLDLREKIRLIVRAAYRQARSDGEPPAFRIVRWRADK